MVILVAIMWLDSSTFRKLGSNLQAGSRDGELWQKFQVRFSVVALSGYHCDFMDILPTYGKPEDQVHHSATWIHKNIGT